MANASLPIPAAVRNLADEAMTKAAWPFSTAADAPPIRNLPSKPFLIYQAWNGEACGGIHNFANIEAAAKRLQLDVYVINSSYIWNAGTKLDALPNDRPGVRTQITLGETYDDISRNLKAVLAKYDLNPISSEVRLVDAKGQLVKTPDAPSGAGVDAIVSALRPALIQLNSSSVGPRGNGR